MRGRINTSYRSDCTGGMFLILSEHIFHSWPQKQRSVPPSDSLTRDFSSPQDCALPGELWLQLCHKSSGSKLSLCRQTGTKSICCVESFELVPCLRPLVDKLSALCCVHTTPKRAQCLPLILSTGEMLPEPASAAGAAQGLGVLGQSVRRV